MPGFAAVCGDEVLEYLLYEFHDGVCEIMVLESVAQNIGDVNFPSCVALRELIDWRTIDTFYKTDTDNEKQGEKT